MFRAQRWLADACGGLSLARFGPMAVQFAISSLDEPSLAILHLDIFLGGSCGHQSSQTLAQTVFDYCSCRVW